MIRSTDGQGECIVPGIIFVRIFTNITPIETFDSTARLHCGGGRNNYNTVCIQETNNFCGTALERKDSHPAMSVAKKRKTTLSSRKTIEIENGFVVDEDDYRAVCQVVSSLYSDWHREIRLTDLLKVDKEHRVCQFKIPNRLSSRAGHIELHASIGQLEKLSHLDMGNYQLYSVPTSIGQLKNLSYLRLWMEGSDHSPPDSIGQLESLVHLRLEVHFGETLPPIGKLKNLKQLELLEWEWLESLPDDIGDLVNLNTLDLQLNELASLPPSIRKLQNMTCLYVHHCPELTSLPDEIGDLVNLKLLYLRNLSQLVSLPSSIGQLKNLQRLDIFECKKLSSLPEEIWNLVNLKSLALDCLDIPMLAEFVGRMTGLMRLKLGHKNQMKSLLMLSKHCHALGSIWIDESFLDDRGDYDEPLKRYNNAYATELYVALACNRARFRFGISRKGTIQIPPKMWPHVLFRAKRYFRPYRQKEITDFGNDVWNPVRACWDWGDADRYPWEHWEFFKHGDEDAIYQLLRMGRGSFTGVIINRQKNATEWQDGQTSRQTGTDGVDSLPVALLMQLLEAG